jgi:hypothetical protein
MARWAGIAVVGTEITIVGANIPNDGPIVIESDQTWGLQKGEKADAYKIMHQQVFDHLTQSKVERVVIKASAKSLGGTSLKHLESAELRGVVISAAASASKVTITAKNAISRNFGERKMDEYVKDDSFWKAEVAGVALRKGSREAAMLLLACREQK